MSPSPQFKKEANIVVILTKTTALVVFETFFERFSIILFAGPLNTKTCPKTKISII